MKNVFKTNVPTLCEDDSSQLIFPFSPPIYQTQIDRFFVDEFLKEGGKLNVKNNDWRHNLAGNMKYGGSYIFDDDFIEKSEKLFSTHALNFLNKINQIKGWHVLVDDMMKIHTSVGKAQKGKLKLDTLWINFQHKHDYNPAHTHTGVLSFVLFCKVPDKIFTENAVSNTRNAGQLIFSYGENFQLTGTDYQITPYDGLMFMFPSKLKHSVPPFWVDEERISVSGNFVVV
jgi:hypothetical protein